jgi:hypothetical protein
MSTRLMAGDIARTEDLKSTVIALVVMAVGFVVLTVVGERSKRP